MTDITEYAKTLGLDTRVEGEEYGPSCVYWFSRDGVEIEAIVGHYLAEQWLAGFDKAMELFKKSDAGTAVCSVCGEEIEQSSTGEGWAIEEAKKKTVLPNYTPPQLLPGWEKPELP